MRGVFNVGESSPETMMGGWRAIVYSNMHYFNKILRMCIYRRKND